jgi:phytoene synthase
VIEGREGELETRPFADETALERYLDAVDGGALRAGAALLIPGPAPPLTHLARALGLARLLKERDAWLQRGRDWTPAAWSQASEAEIVEHARHRLLEALGRARVEVRALPVEAFAAAAPGALLASFARGRRPKGLELRLRLLLASLRGAV